MIDNIFVFLSKLLSDAPAVALLGSFGWGVLSILLSPCHLSSIPLVIGFINSQGDISIKKTFFVSLVFSLGILVTIIFIGILTASLGRLLGDIGAAGNYIVAVVFFIVGLYLLDVLKFSWNGLSLKAGKKRGYTAALILGLLFGIGLGPCTFAFMAPVLGVVFRVAASAPLYSGLLLLAFAAGHCLVIALAGTLSKKVQDYLNWTENSKASSYIKKICGVLVILGGIYMLYAVH